MVSICVYVYIYVYVCVCVLNVLLLQNVYPLKSMCVCAFFIYVSLMSMSCWSYVTIVAHILAPCYVMILKNS